MARHLPEATIAPARIIRAVRKAPSWWGIRTARDCATMMRQNHGIRRIPPVVQKEGVRRPICAAPAGMDCSIVSQPTRARHTKYQELDGEGVDFLRCAGLVAFSPESSVLSMRGDTGSLECHLARLPNNTERIGNLCAESARREVVWGNG